jgi:hypothetical protein
MIEAIAAIGATLISSAFICSLWKWTEAYSDDAAAQRYRNWLNGAK